MKRVFYLIIDQLAGHWAEGVKIEGTDLPPVNIKGYHELGLIPNFSHLISNGLWVKRPWNNGGCDTTHGMRYLATGSYWEESYFEPEHRRPCYWEKGKQAGFFQAAKQHYGDKLTVAVFGTIPWTADFLIPGAYAVCLPDSRSEYLDEVMLREHTLPWLKDTPKWNLTLLYFPMMDWIGDSGCPSYAQSDSNPQFSKHSYILFLDKLVGEITEFLEKGHLWEETYLIITTDHGYHLGCSVAAEKGVKTNNQCCGHGTPYDCEVWDFENNQSTGIYSGGPRRVTFILSGGGLDEKYRGQTIEEAEIIDVIPTIAQLLDVPYECEGKSILP